MSLKLLSALCALLAGAVAAKAGLTWQNPVQAFDLLPESKSVEVHFAFKNDGSTPVTISGFKTSCGCTTARLDKRTYQPGEGGEVIANYHFRGSTGQLRKLVKVNIEGEPEPTVLDIRVLVREPLEIKPTLVFWRVGKPNEPKLIQMKAEKFPVQVKSVTSSDPRVKVKLQTVQPGMEYQLAVETDNTNEKVTAEIQVETDYPEKEPRTYKIYARVK